MKEVSDLAALADPDPDETDPRDPGFRHRAESGKTPRAPGSQNHRKKSQGAARARGIHRHHPAQVPSPRGTHRRMQNPRRTEFARLPATPSRPFWPRRKPRVTRQRSPPPRSAMKSIDSPYFHDQRGRHGLPRAFARLGPAGGRHRPRHHLRPDGHHQHGARRTDRRRRLHHLRHSERLRRRDSKLSPFGYPSPFPA